jgi:hypothetical protein
MDMKKLLDDFCEYHHNECQAEDHMVYYNVNANDNEDYIWAVFVTTNDGRKAYAFRTQREYDSAKWTFYDAYEVCCKSLGINPIEFE